MDCVPPLLVDDSVLARSDVVANCRMNRERRFLGSNSYSADLRLDLESLLRNRLECCTEVAWLDLCCGSGRALVDAAGIFEAECRRGRLRIVGVDLVAGFPDPPAGVQFLEAALQKWRPAQAFDLITCVHGLHYLGNKLEFIRRAVSWLTPGGTFAAHLDLSNLRHTGFARFGSVVGRHFRLAGMEYHRCFRRLTARSPCNFEFPWTYLGADDTAGPNFTGQPAVNSWYSGGSGRVEGRESSV